MVPIKVFIKKLFAPFAASGFSKDNILAISAIDTLQVRFTKLQFDHATAGKLAKIISTSFLFLGIGLVDLQAQQAISATGGNASGNGGTASYSVGQVVYTTNTGNSGSVTQGVQQTYEITVVSGIDNKKDINLSYVIYPNPTTDFLTLKIGGNLQIRFVASLYDIKGKLISMQQIESNESRIEMKNLASGVYFLRVYDAIELIKTFKIIKN